MYPYNCKHCLTTVNDGDAKFYDPIPERMSSEQACFLCLYWLDLAKQDSDGLGIIVAEQSSDFLTWDHLRIGQENTEQNVYKGFCGREFEIEYEDGTKKISTNVWYQGSVPEQFRSIFTTKKAKVSEVWNIS